MNHVSVAIVPHPGITGLVFILKPFS